MLLHRRKFYALPYILTSEKISNGVAQVTETISQINDAISNYIPKIGQSSVYTDPDIDESITGEGCGRKRVIRVNQEELKGRDSS